MCSSRLPIARSASVITARCRRLSSAQEEYTRDLAFPVVRFQGSKDTWVPPDVRAFNFGEAIGVMNYWNCIRLLATERWVGEGRPRQCSGMTP